MKSSLATNSDILHLYPNRNYVSLSTKLSSSTYTKPTGYSFNSPKNETSKVLFNAKPTSNDSSKYLKKTEKYEPQLDRKGSRSSNDGTPKQPNFSSTYTSFNSSPRFNPAPKVKLLDEKRSSVDKSKNSTQELYTLTKYGSTPKASDSINLRDPLKQDNIYSRPKNLEINTEFSSSRIATANKVQPYTTKHRDSADKIPQNEAYKKNTVNTYSFEFISKFSKNTSNPSTNSTEPNEDKNLTSFGKQPVRTNTMVTAKPVYGHSEKTSNTYSNQERASPTKYQTEIQYGHVSSTKNSSSVKVNNFFNNTGTYEPNSSKQADKSLNRTAKNDYDAYNHDDSVAKSVDLSKKMFSKTQMDLKTSLRNSTDDARKETIDVNRSTRDNLSASQTIKQETPSNKGSLNSFVAKVDRGTILFNFAKNFRNV
jgi:hypothetical protein